MVNDGLPSFMCKDCELQLGLAHSFKVQCQKTNAQLKELLSQFSIDSKPYVININNTELQVKNHEPILINDIFNDTNITDEVMLTCILYIIMVYATFFYVTAFKG